MSKIVFASAFERNASFDDNWLEPETWELPWSPAVKLTGPECLNQKGYRHRINQNC